MSGTRKLLMLAGTFLPSGWRIRLWRALGMKIGPGCHVSPMSIIVADEIELGRGVVIETLNLIYSPKRFAIGERSRIASFVRIIGYGVVELAPQSFIALGNLIDTTGGFRLGARSALGPRGIYYSHGATQMIFTSRFPHRIGPVVIGEDSWIGMGCTIYPNIQIGRGCLVFPGLVVSENIPDGKAVLPQMNALRMVPARFVSQLVTDPVLTAAIDSALRHLQGHLPQSVVDDSEPDFLKLKLATGDRIIFLTHPDKKPREFGPRDIYWSYGATGIPDSVTHFDFSRLKVDGASTALAERIAALLCVNLGYHFVFNTAFPSPSSSVAARSPHEEPHEAQRSSGNY